MPLEPSALSLSKGAPDNGLWFDGLTTNVFAKVPFALSLSKGGANNNLLAQRQVYLEAYEIARMGA